MRVLVLGRNVPSIPETIFQFHGQRIDRYRKHTGNLVGRVVPLEHGIADSGRGERGQLRLAVPGPRTAVMA